MVETWTWGQGKCQSLGRGSSWWFLLFLIPFVLSACGKTAPRHVNPEGIELRSQERLFHSARAEFLAAQYPQAIQDLQRFVSTYPHSVFQSKAMWMLARSYHESGDVEHALIQYQAVLDHEQAEAYHQAARKYMVTLQPSVVPLPDGDVVVLQMTVSQWREGRDWAVRLKNMARRGVTTHLIDLECGLTTKDADFLFGESLATSMSSSTSSHDFSIFVQHAHQQGLAVFIGVNIRCLGRMDPASHRRWADHAYVPQADALQATRYFDIFNSEYQTFLKKKLVQLGGTGIDGIVFLGDAPMGMFDGVTPIALAKFQQKFGKVFHPRQVFAGEKRTAQTISTSRPEQNRIILPEDVGFWRWVGWRARERLAVLQVLMGHLQSVYPKIQVSLEVSSGGLSDPLKTLVHFTEDILESQRGQFSFFLVDVHEERPFGGASQLHGRSVPASLPRIAEQFLEVTKDPTKVWLTMPRKLEAQRWSSGSLKDVQGDVDIPQGMGLVYDLRPFS